MKNHQPYKFMHPGRIFRIVVTQPGGAGSSPVETESDIVTGIRFAREKARSVEKYGDGVFQGRDVIRLHFQNPGFGVEIVQGDIAEITYNEATKQYFIESVLDPNDNGRDDWTVECYNEVEKAAC